MPFPEPCGRSREGAGEASAGAHVGRAIERRNVHCSECRGRQLSRRQHCSDRYGEVREGSAASKNPRTHVRSRPGPLMLKGVCRRANPSLELGMTLPPLLLLHCTEAAGNQIPPALGWEAAGGAWPGPSGGRRVGPLGPRCPVPSPSLVGPPQQFLRDLNGSAGPDPYCKRKGSQECPPPL